MVITDITIWQKEMLEHSIEEFKEGGTRGGTSEKGGRRKLI